MADKWNTVKAKLKDRDLDDEFEKFLNESLSDESSASPRRSVTPLGSKAKLSSTAPAGKQKFDLPWWATSEDDEAGASMSEVVKKQWLKKRKSLEGLDIQEDGVDGDPIYTPSQPQQNPLAMSRDSLDANISRPGTGLGTILSESEPSYTDPVKESHDSIDIEEGDIAKKYEDDSFEEGDFAKKYEDDSFEEGDKAKKYEDEYFTGEQTSPSSTPVSVTKTTSTAQPQPGMETLDEIQDKDLFFSKLENTGDVDYGKLNEELDTRNDHLLEESVKGAEVLGLQPYRPVHYDDESSSSNEGKSSSRNDEESTVRKNMDSDGVEKGDQSGDESEIKDTQSDEVSPPRQQEKEEEESSETEATVQRKVSFDVGEEQRQAPQSLLSKVALMESLDSTAGLNFSERLSKLNEQLSAKDATQKPPLATSIPSNEDQLSKTGDTTVDFAEALSNIKQLSTQSFGLQSVEKVMVTRDINKTSLPTPSGGLLLDQNDSKNMPVNQFDLKPVISNFSEEPKIPNEAIQSLFDRSTTSTLAVTQSDLNKVQTFSDMNELIATALVDQYMTQANSNQHMEKLRRSPLQLEKELKHVENEDSRGFSLQPLSSMLEESDQDSPPTDSLKSIKSIAAERKKKLLHKSRNAQREIQSAPADHRLNKKNNVKKRNTISTNQKSKNLKKPSSQNLKKTPQYIVKTKPPKSLSRSSPQKKRNAPAKEDTSKIPEDLLASIEMLSTSLQEFRHDAERNDAILNSTLKDRSLSSKDKVTHLSALQREQNMQDELRELRLQYDDTLKDYEELQRRYMAQQDEWLRTKEQISTEYDRRMKDLHEELFVLKNKLEMSEKDRKTAMDLKVRQFTELSKEDVEHLQKQLQQQESLLNGYQQENERLYKELKDRTSDMKRIESKMFEQNQKLASEVGNLKEQLGNRPPASAASNSVAFSATKINQLENQIKFYKNREMEHKEQIVNLENEVMLWKKKLNQSEKQRTVNETEEGLLKRIEDMKSIHAVELERLNKKMKWYSENQELLDKDTNILKDKREEIKDLRELVDRLENENQKLRREKVVKKSEKNSDNTQILDLKRQVKEMEDIIRRRHPNSLPALIYAASAVPGENKVYESLDGTQSKNVNVFLEKRVKTLEKELEDRDEENSRKVRAVEQQYNAMSLRYEEHVKQLEDKLTEFLLKNKSTKATSDLEADLVRQKTFYEEIIESLKEKLKERQNKLTLRELEYEKLKEGQDPKPHPQNTKREISRLKSKLKSKDSEIDELRSTLYALQRERESLLAISSSNGNMVESRIAQPIEPRLIDHATSPVGKVESKERYLHLEKENNRLRHHIEEIRLEMKEKVLRLEAQEAFVLNEKRKLDEELREQLKLTEETSSRELEKLKMQFAVEHSNSKVAELNGKLKSYELMVDHLNQRLEEAKEDRQRFEKAKAVEDMLRKEIIQLQDELHEARKHFTPEMHHYKMLEAKIASMETRHLSREQELQTLLERARSKNAVELTYAEDKWRDLLREKDLEIMRFRDELDAIIEVLRELKRQGIILPVTDAEQFLI